MSIMQGLEEGFQGFQIIRVIFDPPNWYQFAKILTLAHGLYMWHVLSESKAAKRFQLMVATGRDQPCLGIEICFFPDYERVCLVI